MSNIKEKIEKGAVHAIFIIEIAGRPPEHVEETLKKLVEHFKQQKNIEVIDTAFHKPEPVEALFSSFCEIEFIAETFSRLLELIFDFMPSSVEIIEPETLRLNAADANAIVNDLSNRLHQYDAIAKKLKIEKAIILKKTEETLRELQKSQESQGEKKNEKKKDSKKAKEKIKEVKD